MRYKVLSTRGKRIFLSLYDTAIESNGTETSLEQQQPETTVADSSELPLLFQKIFRQFA